MVSVATFGCAACSRSYWRPRRGGAAQDRAERAPSALPRFHTERFVSPSWAIHWHAAVATLFNPFIHESRTVSPPVV